MLKPTRRLDNRDNPERLLLRYHLPSEETLVGRTVLYQSSDSRSEGKGHNLTSGLKMHHSIYQPISTSR